MGIDVSLCPRDFSLQFLLHGTGPPPSTTRIPATVQRRVVSLLAPACGRMRNNVQRRWEGMFRLRFNPVLKLTDYHISRHVVSTFKRLTTTTTHCDLINFSLNRRGIISTTTPPVSLIVAACSKHSAPRVLASDRKSLDFYRTISLAI